MNEGMNREMDEGVGAQMNVYNNSMDGCVDKLNYEQVNRTLNACVISIQKSKIE